MPCPALHITQPQRAFLFYGLPVKNTLDALTSIVLPVNCELEPLFVFSEFSARSVYLIGRYTAPQVDVADM